MHTRSRQGMSHQLRLPCWAGRAVEGDGRLRAGRAPGFFSAPSKLRVGGGFSDVGSGSVSGLLGVEPDVDVARDA